MSDGSPAKPPLKPLPKPKRQRLRVFRVEGLFGKYDHTIPLRWDERVTVLHGPNGVGKTAVLRLIDAVGRGKVEEVVDEIPFRRVEVELEDGTRMEWREATGGRRKTSRVGQRERSGSFTLSANHLRSSAGMRLSWRRVYWARGLRTGTRR